MKKILILGLTVTSLFISAHAAVKRDSQYPAAYFEPKVIFVDKEAIKSAEKSAPIKFKRKIVFDPKFPAAYFEPKVIYP